MRAILIISILTSVLLAEKPSIDIFLKDGTILKKSISSIDSISFGTIPDSIKLLSVSYYAGNFSLPPDCQNITQCTIDRNEMVHYQYFEGPDSTGNGMKLQKEAWYEQREYPNFKDLSHSTFKENIPGLHGDYTNWDWIGSPGYKLTYLFNDSSRVIITYNKPDTVELPYIIHKHHQFFHEHYFPQD